VTDAASTTSQPIPNPFPDEQFSASGQPLAVTTSVAGRLFVEANASTGVRCRSANEAWVWINLDGVPLATSLRQVASGEPIQGLTGVTDVSSPAGLHSVSVSIRCAVVDDRGRDSLTGPDWLQGSTLVITS
jgi:hypothetical protein